MSTAPPLSFRAVAHRLLPRRRRAHGAVQLGARTPSGGTFVLRIEDTDEARNRPEWTQGIIDSLAWIGISADDPHFEGRYFQSDVRRRRTSRPARGCSRGPRLLLRPHPRPDPGAGEGGGRARLRRLVARSWARAGRRARAAVPGARRRRRSCTTSCAASRVRQRHDRGLRAAARQRHADVPARQRRRRHRDGRSPTSSAPRSTCRTRPSSR